MCFVWCNASKISILAKGKRVSRKFAYDVWGQTVNIASRMERMSAPNRVNVSAATAAAIDGAFALEARGAVEVKGLAPIDMFYVVGPSS